MNSKKKIVYFWFAMNLNTLTLEQLCSKLVKFSRKYRVAPFSVGGIRTLLFARERYLFKYLIFKRTECISR